MPKGKSNPEVFEKEKKVLELRRGGLTFDLIAGGTDGGNRTLDAAGLLDFVSDAGVSIYSNTLGFAQNIIASPQQWSQALSSQLRC